MRATLTASQIENLLAERWEFVLGTRRICAILSPLDDVVRLIGTDRSAGVAIEWDALTDHLHAGENGSDVDLVDLKHFLARVFDGPKAFGAETFRRA